MKIHSIIISTLLLLAIGQVSWSKNPESIQPAEAQNMQLHMQELMEDQDMKDQMKCMQQMGNNQDHKTHSEMMRRMEQMMDRMDSILSTKIDNEVQTSLLDSRYRHDHRKYKD